MKRIVLIVFLLVCYVLAAPGDRKYTVTLAWDPYDWGTTGATNMTNFAFIIYERISTNWVSVTNSGPLTTEVTLQGVSPGVHTYAATAKTPWAESDLSNTASTPRLPGPPVKLLVQPL